MVLRLGVWSQMWWVVAMLHTCIQVAVAAPATKVEDGADWGDEDMGG